MKAKAKAGRFSNQNTKERERGRKLESFIHTLKKSKLWEPLYTEAHDQCDQKKNRLHYKNDSF